MVKKFEFPIRFIAPDEDPAGNNPELKTCCVANVVCGCAQLDSILKDNYLSNGETIA